MSMRWLCRLGLHKERRLRAPEGGWYGRCSRCGRDRDISARIPIA